MRRLDVILILSLIDYDFAETNKELIEKKKEVFVLFCFVLLILFSTILLGFQTRTIQRTREGKDLRF